MTKPRFICGARVLRVDMDTKTDTNGNRGATLYVQAGVSGPLHILRVPGRACSPKIKQLQGKILTRPEYRPRGADEERKGQLMVDEFSLRSEGKIPDLAGIHDDGDARCAGALIVELLGLRKNREGFFATSEGAKTLAGLARQVSRIINEEAGK